MRIPARGSNDRRKGRALGRRGLEHTEANSMIFDKWNLGPRQIGNRLVRSGTSEFASARSGEPNAYLGRLYSDLARGGVGVIVTGYALVREDGRSDEDQNAIHEDRLIAPWKGITNAVHKASSEVLIAAQLVHGGRQCKPGCVASPIAPSAVHDPRAGVTPRALRPDEIWQIIDAFGRAAGRAKAAGFDAIQIHAAHGYLISQFNSPHTNRRTDEWGGGVENRARFFVEVFRRCRREVGDEMPIFAKLNCTDCVKGGITPQDAGEIASVLAEEGLQGVELSGWMYEAPLERAPSRQIDPAPEEEGFFLQEARIVRSIVPRTMPLGLCGGIRSRESIGRLLDDEGFDFVALSRPFIAEPDLARRIEAGQPRVACDSCNECLEGERHPIVNCPPIREGRLYERIGHPDWQQRFTAD